MASSSGTQRWSFEDFIADYLEYLGFDGECFKKEVKTKGHFEGVDTWTQLYERYSNPRRSTDLPLVAMKSDNSSSCWYITPKAKDFPDHRFDPFQDIISMNINGDETSIPMYYHNKIWDFFHEFIFDYLNFLGYHGIDFKYRSLDPKRSEFDRIAQFLEFVNAIYDEDIFKELGDLAEMNQRLGQATIEECLASYFVTGNPAADIPPGSADTPPGPADVPPGSANTPPGPADIPPGSADTPPGLA